MNKKLYLGLALFLMAIILMPIMNVHAESYTVKNQEELKSALQNNDIDTIILGEDIETTEKINITRSVTIDGANHMIKYVGTFGAEGGKDNTVWAGIYVLQFYKTTGTLKNIKLTGGNAGLLINGSDVTFVGTIDVSGNGFGGIELGQGANVTETNKLTLNDADIVNTTENDDHPTLWVPNDSDDAVVTVDGETELIHSGDELTLIEMNEIFDLGTPNTLDNIAAFESTFIISLLSILGVAVLNKRYN